MSPIYDCYCRQCGEKKEVVKRFDSPAPLCCGEAMQILISKPAKINVKGTGGINIHSKGYKDGYAKEYRRRLQEAKS